MTGIEFPVILPLLVIWPRFERGTVCLEGRCSIQLSYQTKPFPPL